MTPLRQRMIDDMRIRNFASGTQRSYIHYVAGFAKYFNRIPEHLDLEAVGVQANCHRAEKLEICRTLLATPYSDLLPRPTDYPNFCARRHLCPKCHTGTMVQLQVLFPCYGPVPMLVDSS